MRPAKQSIDFHYVDPKHAEIHGRLENWSRWCRNNPRSGMSPMFKYYKADNWDRQPPSIPVDKIDAMRVGKGVAALPENYRHSLNWCYVTPCSPGKAAKALGTTLGGLALYVVHARTMLVNRGV